MNVFARFRDAFASRGAPVVTTSFAPLREFSRGRKRHAKRRVRGGSGRHLEDVLRGLALALDRRPYGRGYRFPSDVVVDGPHVLIVPREDEPHPHEVLLGGDSQAENDAEVGSTPGFARRITAPLRRFFPVEGASIENMLVSIFADRSALDLRVTATRAKLEEAESEDLDTLRGEDGVGSRERIRRPPIPWAVVGNMIPWAINGLAEVGPIFTAACNMLGIDPAAITVMWAINPVPVLLAGFFSIAATTGLMTLTHAAAERLLPPLSERFPTLTRVAVAVALLTQVIGLAFSIAVLRAALLGSSTAASPESTSYAIASLMALMLSLATSGAYWEHRARQALVAHTARKTEYRSARATLDARRQMRRRREERIKRLRAASNLATRERATLDKRIETTIAKCVAFERHIRDEIDQDKRRAHDYTRELASVLAEYADEYATQAMLAERPELIAGARRGRSTSEHPTDETPRSLDFVSEAGPHRDNGKWPHAAGM